jgi:predicted alpha/beta hydrolase family esterase
MTERSTPTIENWVKDICGAIDKIREEKKKVFLISQSVGNQAILHYLSKKLYYKKVKQKSKLQLKVGYK